MAKKDAEAQARHRQRVREHYYRNRETILAKRRGIKRTPEQARQHYLRTCERKYGITAAQVEHLLSFPCAICGGTSTDIDHDHVTGSVREALCRKCNRGLGHFNDDPSLLSSAQTYLEQHGKA